MKKKYLILLFTIFISFQIKELKSQTLIDANKVWSVAFFASIGQTSFYKFNGDTTIGIYIYKKLYATNDSTMMNWWCYQNAMREDSNKKVYIYYNLSDVLYYDFALNKNDTFSTPNMQMVVDSIDSVSLLNNEKRKRFFLSGLTMSCDDQWIEGIGSMNSLTNVGSCGINDGFIQLICFTENDTLKYHNSGYNSCYYTSVGTHEINNKENSILIFPNPFYSNLSVKSEIPISTFEIFSVDGKNVYSENPIKIGTLNTYELSLSGLLPAFYIIKITNNLNQIFYEKVIKTP